MYNLIVWNLLVDRMDMYALTKKQYDKIMNDGVLPHKYWKDTMGENYHWNLVNGSTTVVLHNNKLRSKFGLNPSKLQSGKK